MGMPRLFFEQKKENRVYGALNMSIAACNPTFLHTHAN